MFRRNIRVQQFLIIFLSALKFGSLDTCTYFISATKSTDDTRREQPPNPKPNQTRLSPTILRWLQLLVDWRMCCMVLGVVAAPAATRTPAQTTHTHKHPHAHKHPSTGWLYELTMAPTCCGSLACFIGLVNALGTRHAHYIRPHATCHMSHSGQPASLTVCCRAVLLPCWSVTQLCS